MAHGNDDRSATPESALEAFNSYAAELEKDPYSELLAGLGRFAQKINAVLKEQQAQIDDLKQKRRARCDFGPG